MLTLLVAYYPYALATFSPFIKNSNEAMMNNVGDLPAEIRAYYSLDSAPSEIKIQDLNGKQLGILTFNSFEKQDDDAFILINSKTHLIEINDYYLI